MVNRRDKKRVKVRWKQIIKANKVFSSIDKRDSFATIYLRIDVAKITLPKPHPQALNMTQQALKIIDHTDFILLYIHRRRWPTPVTLNRDPVIQIALNMFTKLAEIISATCACIISSAHGMHPTVCVTRTRALTPRPVGRFRTLSHLMRAHRDEYARAPPWIPPRSGGTRAEIGDDSGRSIDTCNRYSGRSGPRYHEGRETWPNTPIARRRSLPSGCWYR